MFASPVYLSLRHPVVYLCLRPPPPYIYVCVTPNIFMFAFAPPRIFKFAQCEYYSRLCVLGDFIYIWRGGGVNLINFVLIFVCFLGDSGKGGW